MASASAQSAQAAEQQYQQTMSRWNALINRRQQNEGSWAQYGSARMAQEEALKNQAIAKEKQQAFRSKREEDLNWGDDAMKGAAMGGSVGGPWGALVGGIAGSAYGSGKAFQRRYKEESKGKHGVLEKLGAGAKSLGKMAVDYKRSLPSGEAGLQNGMTAARTAGAGKMFQSKKQVGTLSENPEAAARYSRETSQGYRDPGYDRDSANYYRGVNPAWDNLYNNSEASASPQDPVVIREDYRAVHRGPRY